MFPANTNLPIFSKVTALSGEYLPKIAGATDAERKKLLCDLATQVFEVWTEWRATLIRSPEDLPAFTSELETHLSRVLMPILAHVRLSEVEIEAIQLTLAGRAQHWFGRCHDA
jgi:hypothetical protein